MPRSIVAAVLWRVESAGDRPLTVAEIAADAGVSVFHLTRAFAAATGIPPARYLRLRRLTRAAGLLADGEMPIVEIALGAGYGSQEAFTRAFADVFGLTPGAVRRGAHIPADLMQECLPMPPVDPVAPLPPPRFEAAGERRILGLAARYSFESNGAIPGQWAEFLALADAADLPLAGSSYGVCFDQAEDGTFTYLAGVEAPARPVPKGLKVVVIPAGRYAVFTHRGPAAGLRDSVAAIWGTHLPEADFEPGTGPDFELYPPGYDPAAPDGAVELWIPVAKPDRRRSAPASTGTAVPGRAG